MGKLQKRKLTYINKVLNILGKVPNILRGSDPDWHIIKQLE
jgi:hypothetical protein